jgi:hypothetical protein
MIHLAISVEGGTEERFVKEILKPHLAHFRVDVVSIVNLRGAVSFERAAADIERLLYNPRHQYVTTLYDFYGFSGRQGADSVAALEERFSAKFRASQKLLPYIQQYEIEALLLSSPEILARYFDLPAKTMREIDAVVQQARGAENVNDSVLNKPSGRLERWTKGGSAMKRYQSKAKAFHFVPILEHIGLPTIRVQCPRFNTWITTLETLSAHP